MNFAQSVLLLASLILTSSSAGAALLQNVVVMGNTMETVVCPAAGTAEVMYYNPQLQPAGKARAYDRATLFQGWGTNRLQIKAGASTINLVRVQLPARGLIVANDVFIPENFVATVAACAQRRGEKLPATKPMFNVPPFIAKAPAAAAETDDDEGEHDEGVEPEDFNPQASIPGGIFGTLNKGMNNILLGLNSSSCCLMPIDHRPTSFLRSPGKFGSGRKAGRIHGGADLYGITGEKVRAVARGQVVRAPYFFKGTTMAIDVMHEGGFVVRYGEISRQGFGLSVGSGVARGQQVGSMAKLPCCAPMLHMELYSGGGAGKLTQGGNKYNRRRDILDPTKYLQKWSLK